MLAALLGPPTVRAASFDCRQAKTFQEKTICADKGLSELDTRLGQAYVKALEEAAEPARIQQEQITWLKVNRAACKSATCLRQVYQQRIKALAAFKPAIWKTFADPGLGLQLSYTSNRTVRRNGHELGLFAQGAGPDAEPIMHFETGIGNFEQAIAATGVFAKDAQGQWRAIIGRFENPPAEKLAGPGWTGILTRITCGVSDAGTGFHAAGGTCLWALLSNGKRYLLADTQGIQGLDAQTLKTLKSVRFLP
ncbi:MAG: lysozyme inhibitor LprI family protein, partial [Candidatus Sericytochromatia bacterium]